MTSPPNADERMSYIRQNSNFLLFANSRPQSKQASPKQKKSNILYRPIKVIGQGAFGVVYCARSPEGAIVAVKKVLQDPKFKNREQSILAQLHHPNCIRLIQAFKTRGKKPEEVFLNLVMNFVPISIHQLNSSYRMKNEYPPIILIKLLGFQIFAGLDYLHSKSIAHRDIKPQNLLVDLDTGQLSICDFGSAKQIRDGDKSVAYIASRFYRSPELVLGCNYYGASIDIWAAGCTIAEMLTAGTPLFQGPTSFGQLIEIAKVIGSPSPTELRFHHDKTLPLPQVEGITLEKALPPHTPPDILNLLSRIFVYNPERRPTARDCMKHSCFDELFAGNLTLPNKRPFPPLERDPS